MEIHAQNLLEEDLKKLIVARNNFARFKKTIIMVDECNGHVMRPYKLKDLDENLSTDYIHCIQYLDLEMKSQILEEKVQVDEEKVFVTLLQRQRSSRQILEISDYLQAHVGQRKFISDISIKKSFDDSTPKWIEVKNAKAFVKYAEEKLSEFKGDAIIIRDSRTEKLPGISSLCKKLDWKYCRQNEIRGSEFSMVIVYDCAIFEYKSFTRAKNNLLIVTLLDKR